MKKDNSYLITFPVDEDVPSGKRILADEAT
jgi:hypothetical protein